MHPETGAFLKLNNKILRIYSLLNSECIEGRFIRQYYLG